ncbi:UDP-N-acetylglucosamine diphosphorylase/glucosamine-1-phosphate N-acetyltransferase [Peptostreptococcaceae bacterium pGA-8]|nr:UDP-N-acetylglucosamine diphosphorylase/glucosamine-1-phosphate N-acetyltransferase [Peptostreptococcaceae bacterium pGA-8]
MTINEYNRKKEANMQRISDFMEAGVDFIDIDSVYIDENVKIGKGTLIGPCVQLQGETVIGENCSIGQNSRLSDAVLGSGVNVESAVILDSMVDDGSSVGPFAYIRPGSKVGKNCKVGDFVELKNATFGDGTKSAHLTYIGDADVGENVNIGCGVVFVNYDGTNKYRSTIEDGVFIGCNSNMVSPVKVEKGSYIAAGTTVTEDVPEDALCIGRSRQKVVKEWAKDRALYRK